MPDRLSRGTGSFREVDVAAERSCIVAIGASAGGLEALTALFPGVPGNTGMAFVVVTHMARAQQSSLVEILGRYAVMPVLTAEQDQAVEPDHVYVCPPDYILTIAQRRLQAQQRDSDAQRRPIDVFMSALAEDIGELAVGILLSGGGSDGSLGLKAIKERGGLTLAQASDGTAPAHSTMPDTAIAAGVVDLAIGVEDMSDRLVQHARSFVPANAPESEEDAGELRDRYQPIYQLLLDQIGHDFSGYKEKTFARRVQRRMQVLQIDALEAYIQYLAGTPEEVTLLFRDLLISVTSFFRDTEAFETLAQQVIPKLFEGKRPIDTVRVWVPGCATGEEAYSVAILLREHMDGLRTPPKVQIFASDIDEPALQIARSGRYPRPLLDAVSPERLKRFFTGDDVSFAVVKPIRDMCVFSAHSVLRDPPFSRIDLVSCRNLLIYLGTGVQGQVVPVFHFALRQSGFLFLGISENVSHHTDLFAPVDKRMRIFQRRDHVATPYKFPMLTPGLLSAAGGLDTRHHATEMTVNLRRAVETQVMERFAPAHVVVNAEGEILHYSPRTGKYLEPAAGLPNRQLLAMARRGIRLDLRSALREAVETRRKVSRERIAIELDERVQLVDIAVEPFGDSGKDPLFIVLFTDIGTPFVPRAGASAVAEGANDQSVERLENELGDTRERLQSTIEEYETAVEEQKSSNEELQSINEEMQSTNEELETSKEELQSVNEELQKVNAELNVKVDEVDRAHDDHYNLFASTQIGTIFLDRELVIRSFTPAATEIFNLIEGDRGRPLRDIANQLNEGDLERETRQVLEQGRSIERKVQNRNGKQHYLMRILPYQARGMTEGVLLTFIDITELTAAEEQQRVLVEELNHRVRNMLTVVNAIATQTLSKSPSPEAFVKTFTGRIRAMGTAYGLVSQQNWGEVTLHDVVEGQTKGVADGRISFDGPAVMCKPDAALALGLVMHELATNATKYGALSSKDGRVAVSWGLRRTSALSLVLEWRETGGPPASAPAHKGFGVQLIERELQHALGGAVAMDYAKGGFSAVITIPLNPALLSAQKEAQPR
jgi:two-component system, chemotaxis family, CheB/CheR fusion protein